MTNKELLLTEENKKEIEYYLFLGLLKQTFTSMDEALPYFAKRFSLDETEAKEISKYWIEHYDEIAKKYYKKSIIKKLKEGK